MEEHTEPLSTDAVPYPYSGPEALRAPVLAALTRVVDPEVAMSIVDVGLIYGVTATDDTLRVELTMTSPACPMSDMVLDDVEQELNRELPDHYAVEVCLVWEPPWDASRMSAQARRFMGW